GGLLVDLPWYAGGDPACATALLERAIAVDGNFTNARTPCEALSPGRPARRRQASAPGRRPRGAAALSVHVGASVSPGSRAAPREPVRDSVVRHALAARAQKARRVPCHEDVGQPSARRHIRALACWAAEHTPRGSTSQPSGGVHAASPCLVHRRNAPHP